MSCFEQIYEIVKRIPKGKVMTYGQIASAVRTTPRVVGYALHANKNPKEIPCHRIVHKDGTLAGGYAFGGPDVQKKLLKQEGVAFMANSVNMQTSQFHNT